MQTTTGSMGSTSGSNLQGSAERSAAKIEELSGSTQDAIGRAAHGTAEGLRHAGERASESLRYATERGQEWMHHQEELLEGARECVRRHPVASVMIAVGVGMLFSRFTRH